MMEPQELRSHFKGVIAFPVTPFHKDLTLDLKGLQENLERLLRHPICAVIAAGGTGKMYSLTPAAHLRVVRPPLVNVAEEELPELRGMLADWKPVLSAARKELQI
jgi:5-dehydro-4-deoxyglucarate dehydratase